MRWLWLRVWVLGGLCPGIISGQRAVVVGIRQYTQSVQTPSLKFSNKDAALFYSFLKRKIPPQNITILVDEQAKLDPVKIALTKALGRAQPNEYVYIFLSARGVARPSDQDGYLGTADLVELKPESTGVAVSDLRAMIRGSRAKPVFLFADVCRDPPTPALDNGINLQLRALDKLDNLVGIVSSDKKKLSLENDQLKAAPNPDGFGVFGYELVRGLPAAATADELIASLMKQVPAATGGYRQTPGQLGPPENRRSALWPVRAMNVASGPLVASLNWNFGLLRLVFFEPQQQQTPGDPQEVARGLLRSGEPEEIAANTKALRGSLPPAQWEDVRDATAAGLAALGQDFLTRYGVSDLLPEDPKRVRKENFAYAERAFREALGLLPDDRTFHEYRRTLESRQHLCGGLKLIYQNQAVSARAELTTARDLVDRPIPEIDNALGISYLEEGKDYGKAIEQFRRAIALSPAWPYPRHNMALAYSEWGDSASSILAYQRAIAAAPGQPYLYYNLGLVLHRANHTRDAAKIYVKTLGILEDAQRTYSARAAEWKDTLAEESKVAAVRASKFGDIRADVYNVMGALDEARHDDKRAQQKYVKALEIRPRFCEATHNLGLLALKQAKGKHRVEQLVRARGYFEQNAKDCPGFGPSERELKGIP